MTSENETKITDVFYNKGTAVTFQAVNVQNGRNVITVKNMNMFITVARCNLNFVNDYYNENLCSKITIKGNYICKNRNELLLNLLKFVLSNFNKFIVYNGNDDDWQNVDLKFPDNILPTEIYDCINQEIKTKHSF